MTELKQKLNNEMQEFKNTYETMTPMQVYNDWYMISFYESYYEMLAYYIDEDLEKDILEWLNTYNNPLAFLYGEWLSSDGAFCMFWDDMIAWLQDTKDHIERWN